MSTLTIRKDISHSCWPDGSRVAVVPVINSEVFLQGHGGPSIQAHLSHLSPDIANSGWRDYGNRQGTRRLLKIFSDLQLPVSVALNSYMIDREAEVFQDILTHSIGENHCVDIIGHGLTNSLSAVKHLTYEEQVEQSLNQINHALPNNTKVTAWLSPGFAAPDNSSDILVRHGIRMSLDATNDDHPYILKSSTNEQEQLFVLPYSMETNDISLCMSQGYTGEQYANTLIDYVDYLRQEDDVHRVQVICFGLHPFIVGTPAKALHLRRAFEKIKQMPNVRFYNCTQLLNSIEK